MTISTMALCADIGSTFTKLLAVDLETGRPAGRAQARTTADTDVMDGFAEACAALGTDHARALTLACSSAGGGLRLAVVGYERVISAEAGHRVALSAGSRVVHVASGRLEGDALRTLAAEAPDVVLLVGGTDGGDETVLLHNAEMLSGAALGVPVVVAGNADAQNVAVRLLVGGDVTAIPAANVLPDIGVLDPEPARRAIREVFLRHVIAGKHLSAGADFAAMVRAATPDAVLSGVELLSDLLATTDDAGAADDSAGDLVVVDVGGATTDVYSAVRPGAEDRALLRDAVGTAQFARTVEGDLGVRWNAPGVVDAARSERLLEPGEEQFLRPAARSRAEDPAYLPDGPEHAATDRRLAHLAATVALRRHARPDGGAGRDLREARLVVGSGGVFRAAPPTAALDVLQRVLDDRAGGWKRPERAAVVVDDQYVLAAAGLLAADHPEAARGLLNSALLPARRQTAHAVQASR